MKKIKAFFNAVKKSADWWNYYGYCRKYGTLVRMLEAIHNLEKIEQEHKMAYYIGYLIHPFVNV